MVWTKNENLLTFFFISKCEKKNEEENNAWI